MSFKSPGTGSPTLRDRGKLGARLAGVGALALALGWASLAQAEVTPEEAKQLRCLRSGQRKDNSDCSPPGYWDGIGTRNAFLYEILTLRLGYTSVGGARKDEFLSAVMFFDPEIISTSGVFTSRIALFAALGSGTAGLDGLFSGAAMYGVRSLLTPDSGLFVRGGLTWQIAGNDRFYRSQLDLPAAELGYQLLTHDLIVEAGPTVGLVPDGRYNFTDDARHAIPPSASLGGRLLVQTDWFRLSVSGNRVFEPHHHLDELRADACVEPASIFILCAQGALQSGPVNLTGGGSGAVDSSFVGLTFGFGMLGIDRKSNTPDPPKPPAPPLPPPQPQWTPGPAATHPIPPSAPGTPTPPAAGTPTPKAPTTPPAPAAPVAPRQPGR